jgi:hypothetical protein
MSPVTATPIHSEPARVMPLKRGVARYYDLAAKRNFHGGLLKKAADSKIGTEINFHIALRMRLLKDVSQGGQKDAFR